MKVDWNEETVAFITEACLAGQSKTWIASQIGVTRNSVIGKLHRLKLRKSHDPVTSSSGVVIKPWSPEEVARLGKLSQIMTRGEVARVLGRTVEGVKKMGARHKLTFVAYDPHKRPNVGARNALAAAEREPHRVVPMIPRQPDTAPDSAVAFGALSHGQCRWVYGDPRTDFDGVRFCAASARGSYCADHHALVYRAAA